VFAIKQHPPQTVAKIFVAIEDPRVCLTQLRQDAAAFLYGVVMLFANRVVLLRNMTFVNKHSVYEKMHGHRRKLNRIS